MSNEFPKFSDLLGRTLIEVKNFDNDEIQFATDDGKRFRLYHDQDCCESVNVDEIIGNLDDLIGSPLTMADESSSDERPAEVPKHESVEPVAEDSPSAQRKKPIYNAHAKAPDGSVLAATRMPQLLGVA